MWRPEKKWNAIRKHDFDLNVSGAKDSHFQPASENEAKYYLEGYENGADAMLKMLRESPDSARVEIPQGSYTFGTTSRMISLVNAIPGTWVFIPDDDVEEK